MKNIKGCSLGQNLFSHRKATSVEDETWLIVITPTRWCGIRMSAHQATPWSYKFRIWKRLCYFLLYKFRWDTFS